MNSEDYGNDNDDVYATLKFTVIIRAAVEPKPESTESPDAHAFKRKTSSALTSAVISARLKMQDRKMRDRIHFNALRKWSFNTKNILNIVVSAQKIDPKVKCCNLKKYFLVLSEILDSYFKC